MGYYQDFGWTDEQAWGGTPDDYDYPPSQGGDMTEQAAELRLQLMTLERDVNAKLADIAGHFTPEMRLTLVARHPDNPECYFIFTRDDPAAVAALVAKDKHHRDTARDEP